MQKYFPADDICHKSNKICVLYLGKPRRLILIQMEQDKLLAVALIETYEEYLETLTCLKRKWQSICMRFGVPSPEVVLQLFFCLTLFFQSVVLSFAALSCIMCRGSNAR